jgi:hypothetical protein
MIDFYNKKKDDNDDAHGKKRNKENEREQR